MYRLIYKSRSAETIDWALVHSILFSSKEENRKRAITGVLLATETHFLQVLEGGFEDVNDTFMRIAADSRHNEIRLICFHPVNEKLFTDWGMQGIGLFETNQDLKAMFSDKHGFVAMLKDKYGEESGTVKMPLEEWSALSLIQDARIVHELSTRRV